MLKLYGFVKVSFTVAEILMAHLLPRVKDDALLAPHARVVAT